jgi:hypothetical protein
MTREELIRIVQRVLDIHQTFKEMDLDDEAAFALEDEKLALFGVLQLCRLRPRSCCHGAKTASSAHRSAVALRRRLSSRARTIPIGDC